MDKKAKKRLDVLNKKLQKLQQQLAGAKQQMDEPDEADRLDKEVTATKEEITKIKAS